MIEVGLFLVLLWLRLCRSVRIIPGMLDVSFWSADNMTLNIEYAPLKRNAKVQSPEDHLVESLPYLDTSTFPTKHYAGYLPASSDESDKQIFYWLFSPDFANDDVDSVDIPLILWLNGGPGCSSLIGLFLENGPFRIHAGLDQRYTFESNTHSWHKAPAWVLYIDQPVGTGLSFTTKQNYCDTDAKINTDFYYFMTQFFLLHRGKFLEEDGNGRLTVNRPFFLSGESHAGHYIPSMMNYILQQNEYLITSHTDNRVIMPLSGAAIGNGWIHPYYQYAGAEAAYLMGLIDVAQKRGQDEAEITCQARLDAKIFDGSQCLSLIDDIVANANGLGALGINSYDVSINANGQYPPGQDLIENYLNSDPVLQSLHVSEYKNYGSYRVCANKPYYALAHQDGLGVADELSRVLDHPSRPQILIYNGMRDMVCNHVGTERTLENLHWHGRDNWIVAKRYTFTVGSTAHPDGFVKEFDNLIFLKIPEAGHMVPLDKPAISLEMIRRLIYNLGLEFFEQDMNSQFPCNASIIECPHCMSCRDASNPLDYSSANTSASIATFSFMTTFLGFALGAGISCFMYSVWRKSSRISNPPSQTTIANGVGEIN